MKLIIRQDRRDGFTIVDRAIANHFHRGIKPSGHDFNVFAFIGVDARGLQIICRIGVDLLRQNARER